MFLGEEAFVFGLEIRTERYGVFKFFPALLQNIHGVTIGNAHKVPLRELANAVDQAGGHKLVEQGEIGFAIFQGAPRGMVV